MQIEVLAISCSQLITCSQLIHSPLLLHLKFLTDYNRNIYRKISGKVRHHTPAAVQNEDGSAPLQPHPMLKFYLFAWGIPVVICGITGAVDINFYNNKE